MPYSKRITFESQHKVIKLIAVQYIYSQKPFWVGVADLLSIIIFLAYINGFISLYIFFVKQIIQKMLFFCYRAW